MAFSLDDIASDGDGSFQDNIIGADTIAARFAMMIGAKVCLAVLREHVGEVEITDVQINIETEDDEGEVLLTGISD